MNVSVRIVCSTHGMERALFVLCTAFALLTAFPASAICEAGGASQPSVGVSYAGPDEFGSGTVSVSYNFPNTDSYLQRVVDVYRDGILWYEFRPPAMGGNESFALSFACLTTG